MSRIAPLSGYPEFLPAHAAIEQRAIDIVRRVFEVHGFGRIETRAVEPLEQLSRKGDINKEVYVVRRLHADQDDTAELGLHFDLTVPFARYVLENAGKLNFPFRRYQIQKVWRGERPQDGRYREFLQADVDVIGLDALAAHHDREVLEGALAALQEVHTQLGVPPVLLRVNHRKLAQGIYSALGISDPLAVLQIVDKLDKLRALDVEKLLIEHGLTSEKAAKVLEVAQIQATDGASLQAAVQALGLEGDDLDAGLAELAHLVDAISAKFPGRIVADLRIARGLDYYTGVVFEAELVGFESLKAIAAGGRYDSLATDGKKTYPGVGISIGLTRMLVPLLAKGALHASRSVPSAVLVAVDDEDTRADADDVAAALRARGICCEVAPKADKFGKQIRYAERRGIPFVWFGGIQGRPKDIRSGEQIEADAHTWTPPAEDLVVAVSGSSEN